MMGDNVNSQAQHKEEEQSPETWEGFRLKEGREKETYHSVRTERFMLLLLFLVIEEVMLSKSRDDRVNH